MIFLKGQGVLPVGVHVRFVTLHVHVTVTSTFTFTHIGVTGNQARLRAYRLESGTVFQRGWPGELEWLGWKLET